METREIKGTELAAGIEAEVKAAAAELKAQGIEPHMAAVWSGADPSMLAYIRSKARAAERLGIAFEAVEVKGSEAELETELRRLSQDPAVHGIVLELPLGPGQDFVTAIQSLEPQKDIDGLTPFNLGLMLRGAEDKGMAGATAMACIMLMETLGELGGKRVTLIGRGRTVGRPLLPLLLNRHATVTVAHSQTKDLKAAVSGADIVVSATGVVGLLTPDIIAPGQIVIDAGLTVVGKEIKGDADRAALEGVAAAITPVPEGVGPVTTALVFRNLIKAAKKSIQ